MCQGYTFCQQSQRKLYSVSYKTVISCFANIPIHPSLWCDSTVEKQNRHNLKTQPSSSPSCREPWGISAATCPPENLNKEILPFLWQDLLEARQGGGKSNSRADHRTSSSPGGCLPLGCIASSQDAQFPKHIDVPVWGLHSLPVCSWTQVGSVILFKLLLLQLPRATRF